MQATSRAGDIDHSSERWLAVHLGLKKLSAQRAQMEAREVALLRLAEDMTIWQHFGHVSLVQYMEQELGYRAHTAMELVRTAKALATLPHMTAALEAGEVFPCAIRELTRIATPETEEEWLEAIAGKTVHEVQRMVAGHDKGARPGDPKDPDNELITLTFRVSPTVHAFAYRARMELEAMLGSGKLDDDELIETIYRRALEEVSTTEGQPAFQMAISTCKRCQQSYQSVAGEEIEVDAATLARAECDHEHLGDLEADAPPRVTASVTKRKRRQIYARDGHCCAVPGCRMTRYLDIHHVTFQSDGGGHELSNTILLCTGHHAAVHKGRLRITGKAPDEVIFEFVGRDEVAALVPRDSTRAVPWDERRAEPIPWDSKEVVPRDKPT
ncbi:MAG TPA: HNH endonuclease signature motif containing protein [Kofleriaceae bacterium]|nr:HNH endonuclease signature motif containing protein [Kofleriaceae bacterium]